MPDFNAFQPASLPPELLSALQDLEREINARTGGPVYLMAYSPKK